ncbi:phosphate signaling complex protein PhoU [Acidipropionibacterium timonense]|uniref:phosphate signaling complex protein PhoU n=1 Tax=Acidipropionibacterium timonense TaxID=2161818 RepID=UPI0010301468|nr:phosphate signaling complex protein PhoU [Acidipropionibacterium timonense]
MRESYHDELNATTEQIVTMAGLVRTAVRDATEALVGADLTTAERVISDDAKVDALNDEIEQRSFQLLARQAPVAGELRTVVAVLRMTYELSRMGDLAAHVAKIARLRYPEVAAPEPVARQFEQMATIADSMIATAISTLEDRDADAARDLASQDSSMDELRREQFRMLLGDDWTYGVEKAVDTALLGRYYERIADHAVAVGSRVIYIVTGEAPEGEDWPKAF